MKDFKYNRWLIAVIVIGLLAALAIGFQRHAVEQANRQVDMAIDYEGLQELAQREGLPEHVVLQQAKEAGITSLAVYETTFKKLNENGKATALPGSQILAGYHAGTLSDPVWRQLVATGEIQGSEVYVVGHDPQTYREVKEDLLRRLGEDRVKILTVGSEEVLAVKAHYESFIKMNLGMPTDEMKAVNDAGFYVLARPSNYEECTPDDVKAVFQRLDGFRISEIVFSGNQSLGAPQALQTTIDEMKAHDINLGLIEATTQLQFYKQDGMEEIAKGLGYDHVARLYSIPKDEQPKLKIDTAVERWSNTDEERNIRIDLLRIYDKPSPNMSLLKTNMDYFKATHDKLVAHGYTIGPAGTFAIYNPSVILRALVMLGVAAAGVLYLSLVIPRLNARPRYQFILFLAFGLLAAVPVLMGNGSKIRVVAALASANVFPALAVIFQLDRVRAFHEKTRIHFIRLLVTAAVALFVTGALSYIGAAYLSASLADTPYFLEFNIFRGIKLTFVLPLVLVGIAFLQRFDIFDGRMDDTQGVMEQLKRILDMPVKVKTLIGLFLVLVAGIVFVARSGHTSGMPVSQTELRFRAFLEQAFYARPRTKELLIGHPAFMLAAMAVLRKWPTMVFFALVLVATIGQGSMVETFAHMRTPVYMSFMRGIGGIVLGAGIGAAAMILVELWQMILARARHAHENEKERNAD
ncbi:MAG: DUF5693 family protein [Selenomonadaceae bacterium]|nr:DUF5693 family protein [Selenomonadaceae bacterium]